MENLVGESSPLELRGIGNLTLYPRSPNKRTALREAGYCHSPLLKQYCNRCKNSCSPKGPLKSWYKGVLQGQGPMEDFHVQTIILGTKSSRLNEIGQLMDLISDTVTILNYVFPELVV